MISKNCRCPPSRWNFVSARESTRCTYIFSVRRWQRRSTVMIVAFATNCRSPPLFGRPGERCLCFALQCSADAATIATTNIFAKISVLQYCCCCYKNWFCYNMWPPHRCRYSAFYDLHCSGSINDSAGTTYTTIVTLIAATLATWRLPERCHCSLSPTLLQVSNCIPNNVPKSTHLWRNPQSRGQTECTQHKVCVHMVYTTVPPKAIDTRDI